MTSTWRLAPGSTTALLGPSGSGKTTLLRTVNGMVRPTAGRVQNCGLDPAALSADDLLRLRRATGYVIQEIGLFPHMTVARNADLAGLDLDEFTPRHPWQLSVDTQHRDPAEVVRDFRHSEDL